MSPSLLPRLRTTACAALVMALALHVPETCGQAASSPPPKIQQLRIYEIFDGNKAQFHARFRDHAARIMHRHGFSIVAMWETRHGERTEFAYLLQWPDQTAMRTAWSAFMADEEWSRIKRETRVHGPMVGQIQDRTLVPVEYSPQGEFALTSP